MFSTFGQNSHIYTIPLYNIIYSFNGKNYMKWKLKRFDHAMLDYTIVIISCQQQVLLYQNY